MFKGMTKDLKLKTARTIWMDARDKDVRFQMNAHEAFSFRDGFQWTQEERQILEHEMRPALTLNLTKSSIDLVMGIAEDTKVDYRCSPAEPSDGFLCEVLNDIVQWVGDRFEFSEEEDGAFESSVICGRGYVALDFLPDPEKFGEIQFQEVNVPVHEVHFDPAARRHRLDDSSFICWNRWLTKSDFKMRYPHISNKKIDELADINTISSLGEMTGSQHAQSAFQYPGDTDNMDDRDYETPLNYDWYDRSKNMIRVIQMEYWEPFTRYFVFNLESNKFEEVPVKPTKEMKAEFLEEFGEEMTVETMMDKKVKWLIFTGKEILFDSDSPMPYKGFSIVPIFAYRDMSQRTTNHFGLVHLIKDPQKEVNKRWSQSLNMLNQQVQNGLFAEVDAFVDKQQAEQSLKEAGGVTYVNNGALTSGKIQERKVPSFPNAAMQMEEFSQAMIKKITGINPDLMGEDRGRQDAGVVIRLRQQQGILLLKPLFRSYNSAKKELFKRLISIITEFMPDDQILRILGQNGKYEIDAETGVITDNENGLQADVRDVRNLEYNVVAEPAPGNLSKRMLELSALLEMSQQLPVPPDQIIEKMEIPASEKARWIEFINTQQTQEAEMAEKQMQLEQSKIQQAETTKQQGDMMDFIVDLSKIKQMTKKDENKMTQDFKRLELEEQKEAVNALLQMTQMLAANTGGNNEQTEQPKQ